MSDYELFGDLLLVRVISGGNRTRGGLYLPESAVDGTLWMHGEVVERSEGWHNANGAFIAMPPQIGDIVLFFRNQSKQIVFPVDNEEMLLIRFTDVGGRRKNLGKASVLKSVDGTPLVLQ